MGQLGAKPYIDPGGALIARAAALMSLSTLDAGHVKGILEHAGAQWVVVGRASMGEHDLGVDLQGLVPASQYAGETFARPKPTGTFPPGQLYTGRVITHKGRSYVMTDERMTVKLPEAEDAAIRAAAHARAAQRPHWQPLSKYGHELNGAGARVGQLRVEPGRVVSADGIVYRQPVPGEPEVPDLVQPGDVIRSSYGSGGRVLNVAGYTVCACAGGPGEHAPTSDCHPLCCWSIAFVEKSHDPGPEGRVHPSAWCAINELVAVGGRLVKLFEANPDEVWVVEHAGRAVPLPEPAVATAAPRPRTQLQFEL